MKKNYFLVLALSLIHLSLLAQDGTLDPSFGDGGIVIQDIQDGQDFLHTLVEGQNGEIWVAGAAQFGNQTIPTIAKYSSSGVLDNSFGDEGYVAHPFGNTYDFFGEIGLQSDSKILAAGIIGTSSNKTYTVVRYSSDGNLDSTFGTNGTLEPNLPNGELSRMIISTNDQLLFLGTTNDGSNSTIDILRYTIDGNLDTTFGTNGLASTVLDKPHIYLKSAIVTPNNDLIVLGDGEDNLTAEVVLAKFNNDGTLDTNFGDNGFSSTTFTSTVEEFHIGTSFDIANDGSIFITGSYGSCLDTYYSFLIKHQPNGALDTSFGDDGIKTLPPSFAIPLNLMIQENGRLLIATEVLDCFEGWYLRLKRYFPNGNEDTAFTSETVEFETTQAMLTTEGKFVVVGHTWWYGGVIDFVLARYNLEVLGLSENNLANFSLSPNPSAGAFVITHDLIEKTPYQISDISGKIIHQGNLTGTQTTINLSNVQQGIYFLKTSGQTIKLIKE